LPRTAFLLFAVVYLYAFPYFDQLRSANEMPRILMTQEIVDHRVFHLDRRLAEMGSQGDLSRGPNGHIYPNKAPGPRCWPCRRTSCSSRSAGRRCARARGRSEPRR